MATTLTKIDASEYLVDGEALAGSDLAAEGTEGHVLTSNGTDDKPTWQEPSGLVLLDTQEVSSAPTVNFSGLTGDYTLYKIVFYDVESASDDQIFVLRTSSDNGASFDSGASDYKYVNIALSATGSTGDTVDNAASSIRLTATGAGWGFGTGSNEVGDGEITIFNPQGTNHTKVLSDITYITSSGNHAMARSAGSRASTDPVDAVQLLFGSGDIETGTFKLYGLK